MRVIKATTAPLFATFVLAILAGRCAAILYTCRNAALPACSEYISKVCDESRNHQGPNKCDYSADCAGDRTCSFFGNCEGESNIATIDCPPGSDAPSRHLQTQESTNDCNSHVSSLSSFLLETGVSASTNDAIIADVNGGSTTLEVAPEDNELTDAFANLSEADYNTHQARLNNIIASVPSGKCHALEIELTKVNTYLTNSRLFASSAVNEQTQSQQNEETQAAAVLPSPAEIQEEIKPVEETATVEQTPVGVTEERTQPVVTETPVQEEHTQPVVAETPIQEEHTQPVVAETPVQEEQIVTQEENTPEENQTAETKPEVVTTEETQPVAVEQAAETSENQPSTEAEQTPAVVTSVPEAVTETVENTEGLSSQAQKDLEVLISKEDLNDPDIPADIKEAEKEIMEFAEQNKQAVTGVQPTSDSPVQEAFTGEEQEVEHVEPTSSENQVTVAAVPSAEQTEESQAEEPVTQAEEPVTQAEEPVTQTEEPVTQTEEPVTQAEEPVTQAEEQTVEQVSEEKPAQEQAIVAGREQPNEENPVEHPSDKQTSEEQITEEASAEKPAAEQTVFAADQEEPAEEETSAEQPAEEKTSEEVTATEQPEESQSTAVESPVEETTTEEETPAQTEEESPAVIEGGEESEQSDENEAYKLVLDAMRASPESPEETSLLDIKPLFGSEKPVEVEATESAPAEEPAAPVSSETSPKLNNAVQQMLSLSEEFAGKFKAIGGSDGKTINELVDEFAVDLYTDGELKVDGVPAEWNVQNVAVAKVDEEVEEIGKEVQNLEEITPLPEPKVAVQEAEPVQTEETAVASEEQPAEEQASPVSEEHPVEEQAIAAPEEQSVEEEAPVEEAVVSQEVAPVEEQKVTEETAPVKEQEVSGETAPVQEQNTVVISQPAVTEEQSAVNVESAPVEEEATSSEENTPVEEVVNEQIAPADIQNSVTEELTPAVQEVTSTVQENIPQTQELAPIEEQQTAVEQAVATEDQEVDNAVQYSPAEGETLSELLTSDNKAAENAPAETNEENEQSVPEAGLRMLTILKLYKEHVNYRDSNHIVDHRHYGHLRDFHRHLACLTDNSCDFAQHLHLMEREHQDRIAQQARHLETAQTTEERGFFGKVWCGIRKFFRRPCPEPEAQATVSSPAHLETQPESRGWFGRAWCSIRKFFGRPCPEVVAEPVVRTSTATAAHLMGDEEESGFFTFMTSRKLAHYLNSAEKHLIAHKQEDQGDNSGEERTVASADDQSIQEESTESAPAETTEDAESPVADEKEPVAVSTAEVTEIADAGNDPEGVQEAVQKLIDQLPECISNEDIKEASHNFIEKAHEWLTRADQSFPRISADIARGVDITKVAAEFGINLTPQQLKAIVDSLHTKVISQLDQTFSADAFDHNAQKLESLRNSLADLKNGLRSYLPVESVLEKDLEELVDKLDKQTKVLYEAKDASEEDITAARQTLAKFVDAEFNGIDINAASDKIKSILTSIKEVANGKLGKSLNEENLNFIVHRVVQAFHADLERTKDSSKPSDFVIDTDDLDLLVDNVIDELKKSRESNQKAIIDLRDFHSWVQSENKLLDFDVNTGNKALDAAESWIKYENAVYDTLGSPEFGEQLKNYISKYYNVLKAHTKPWSPLVVYSQAYKALTKDITEVDSIPQGEVANRRALVMMRSAIGSQIRHMDKLSQEDRQFFQFFNSLLAEWAQSKDEKMFARKLDQIIRSLQGHQTGLRKLSLVKAAPSHKLIDQITKFKQSVSGIVDNLGTAYDSSIKLSDTIGEGQTLVQQAKDFFTLKNPVLSGNSQQSSGFFGKIKSWFGSRRLEKHFGVAETFESLKNLYNDLDTAHKTAEELKKNVETAKTFANEVKDVFKAVGGIVA